jgi:hypothetical protein
MRPVPHLARIIDRDDASRLIVRTKSSTLKAGPRRMNTWMLDTAIARLPSINAVCVDRTVQLPDGRQALPYRIMEGLAVIRQERGIT